MQLVMLEQTSKGIKLYSRMPDFGRSIDASIGSETGYKHNWNFFPFHS